MAEETTTNTSSGASATPTPETPATGTPAPESATPQKPTLTVEELMKRVADLEHSQRNATEEVDRHRKKLSAYEKAEREAQAAKQAAEEAQLSEIERTKKHYADLQARFETEVRQKQERIVRYEVEAQAHKLGIIDPDAAVKLLDWSHFEYNDDGTPTNTEQLLKTLIKDKPYLKAPEPQAQHQQETLTGQPQLQQTRPPAVPAMNPGRAQIASPTQPPPGTKPRIPRFSDPGVFVSPGTASPYQP